MKLKIRYKSESEEIFPIIEPKGEWFDLKTAEPVVFRTPEVVNKNEVYIQSKLISLGIAIELPKGYEAIIVPRSSLFAKKGIILANSQGVIDTAYNGDDDIWKFHAIAIRPSILSQYEKICQFKIQLSQKAPWWVKLKWLFITKIEFTRVESLNNLNRGGFGSTKGYK